MKLYCNPLDEERYSYEIERQFKKDDDLACILGGLFILLTFFTGIIIGFKIL